MALVEADVAVNVFYKERPADIPQRAWDFLREAIGQQLIHHINTGEDGWSTVTELLDSSDLTCHKETARKDCEWLYNMGYLVKLPAMTLGSASFYKASELGVDVCLAGWATDQDLIDAGIPAVS